MRLLDVLIATLVLVPFFGEWRYLDVPGLGKMEVSDLGIPLLGASLIVLAMLNLSRAQWQIAIAAPRLQETIRAARATLQRSPRRVIAGAAIAIALLLIAVVLWRHIAASVPGLGVGSVIWYVTHGTGAVLLIAPFAVAVRSWSGQPWEASFFVGQTIRLGRAWYAAIGRHPARTLWGAAAAVGALLFWNSLVRHRAFESHGFDLGIFTNVLWNLTQGNGYVSSLKGGMNLFADHQSPLLWALAPVFAAAPHPETLLFVQAFGLAAGGPALYFLARPHCDREHWAPTALPWLYWSYLPLRNANAFDFHPEVLMLPLFLWAFAGFASSARWVKGLGVVALVAALGAKESAPIVAVGLGIAWTLMSGRGAGRSRWPGAALALTGVAVFLFDVKVVPRIFGAEDYAYLEQYGRFGDGIGALLLAPFTQPAYFLSETFNPARLNFLFWTLAPLGFLPLFELRAAFAALPPYLVLFLSEGDQRVRLVFHYGIEPATALFWALPFGLVAFARRFGWTRAGYWMVFWAIAAHGTNELTRVREYIQYLHADWLRTEFVPCLHPSAPMAASDSLAPHLATRTWISYPDQLVQKPSGEAVSCVVVDLGVSNWPLGREGTRRVIADLPELGYREAWRCHDLRVYELKDAGCLRCTPRCL